jgi:hypothetical protein
LEGIPLEKRGEANAECLIESKPHSHIGHRGEQQDCRMKNEELTIKSEIGDGVRGIKGCWILDAGFWYLSFGAWNSVLGILNRCRLLDFGIWYLSSGAWNFE